MKEKEKKDEKKEVNFRSVRCDPCTSSSTQVHLLEQMPDADCHSAPVKKKKKEHFRQNLQTLLRNVSH